MSLLRSRRFWGGIALATSCFYAMILFFGRAPDFRIEWNREMPSYHTPAELEVAVNDPAKWPVFHHGLKQVELFRVSSEGTETPVDAGALPEQGMHAVFSFEPKGKEWKRFKLKAEITEFEAGRAIGFKLLEDSTDKVTRILDDQRWSFSVGLPKETQSGRGYKSLLQGSASAVTKARRARFFGRFARKILMNQIYSVDLARLANFSDNEEAAAGGFAPVYK
jgi:hypothetical protein